MFSVFALVVFFLCESIVQNQCRAKAHVEIEREDERRQEEVKLVVDEAAKDKAWKDYQERRLKHARQHARDEAYERQIVREQLLDEIFPMEEKLSEAERSRGWMLLTDFGKVHMPKLTESCVKARRKALCAKSNLDKLVAVMEAENTELETNAAYQDAKNLWLDSAAEYWMLRYRLTDAYSAFRLGVERVPRCVL